MALWAGVVLGPLLTASALVGAWQGGSGLGGTTLDAAGLPLPWAGALAVAQSLLVSAALYQLAALLGQVQAERLFPQQASGRVRRFAALLLLAVIVHGPASAVLAAVLGPHEGTVAIALDMADLLALLVTAVLWLVARFFDAASRLEDDHRSIV